MTRKFSRTTFALGTTFALVCFTLLCALLAPAAPAQECSISQVAGKWAAWTQGNVNGIGPRVSAGGIGPRYRRRHQCKEGQRAAPRGHERSTLT